MNGLHSFGTILKHEPWKKSMELKEVNTIITVGDSFTDMVVGENNLVIGTMMYKLYNCSLVII